MTDTWFPLYQDMLESETYMKGLTPAEKVITMILISEWGLQKYKGEQMYRSRESIAAALGVSVRTVSTAWNKLEKFEWVKKAEGFSTIHKSMGTHIKDVCHADVTDVRKTGKYFIQMSRFTFEYMLSLVRQGTLKFEHIHIYAVCCFFHLVNQQNEFEMKNVKWLEKTGFSRVKRLVEFMEVLKKAGLIDFEAPYGKIVLKAVHVRRKEDTTARAWVKEVNANTHKMKAKRTSAKRKNYIAGESPESVHECIDMFEQLAQKKFRTKIQIPESAKTRFINKQVSGKEPENVKVKRVEQNVRKFISNYDKEPRIIFTMYVMELMMNMESAEIMEPRENEKIPS